MASRARLLPRLRPLAPRPRSNPVQFARTRPSSTSTQTSTPASAQTTLEAGSPVSILKNVLFGTSLTLFAAFGYLYVTDTRASAHQWLVVPAIRYIYSDAEDAHHAGTSILKALYNFGLNPRERGEVDAKGDLSVEVFGHTLLNPIGTSGGLDKNADIPSPLFDLGPAIVEVGGITPLPQDGNPKPRVFRLPSQNALINRYGLNSEGAERVALRLRQRVREFAYSLGLGMGEEAERLVLDGEAGVPPGSLTPGKLMAVQIAKNKTTPDQDIEAVKRDYVICVDKMGKYADIIVVNVSSPNTPGLRSLQQVEPLTRILSGVVDAAKSVDRKTKPAVMVKVSPDEESEEQLSGICEAIWQSGVDGVIVGNTTKRRPDPLPKGYVLPSKEAMTIHEDGGYSGPQMFDRTLSLVKRYRKMLDDGPRIERSAPIEPTPAPAAAPEPIAEISGDKPKKQEAKAEDGAPPPAPLEAPSEPVEPIKVAETKPEKPSIDPFSQPPKVIFATGGITNGKQALEILNAGASVAMVYTALVYGGTGKITRMKQEMREEINKK